MRLTMPLYNVELAESVPEGALLLAIVADALHDLEIRRNLPSAARFLLSPEIASISDLLDLDLNALRQRAKRLCPSLERHALPKPPPAVRYVPERHDLCQRGHPIEPDAKGKRYCHTCRRATHRAYMQRVREAKQPACTTHVA